MDFRQREPERYGFPSQPRPLALCWLHWFTSGRYCPNLTEKLYLCQAIALCLYLPHRRNIVFSTGNDSPTKLTDDKEIATPAVGRRRAPDRLRPEKSHRRSTSSSMGISSCTAAPYICWPGATPWRWCEPSFQRLCCSVSAKLPPETQWPAQTDHRPE